MSDDAGADGLGGLDWPGLMRAGMRGLRLRPADFWALTPAELGLMLGEAAGTPPLTRGRLEELAAQWPDRGPDLEPDEGSGLVAGLGADEEFEPDYGALSALGRFTRLKDEPQD